MYRFVLFWPHHYTPALPGFSPAQTPETPIFYCAPCKKHHATKKGTTINKNTAPIMMMPILCFKENVAWNIQTSTACEDLPATAPLS
jgi:hypothetical protein